MVLVSTGMLDFSESPVRAEDSNPFSRATREGLVPSGIRPYSLKTPRSRKLSHIVDQWIMVRWRDFQNSCNARKPAQVARRVFTVQEVVTCNTDDSLLYIAFGLLHVVIR